MDHLNHKNEYEKRYYHGNQMAGRPPRRPGKHVDIIGRRQQQHKRG
jgi:hypothetical protein